MPRKPASEHPEHTKSEPNDCSYHHACTLHSVLHISLLALQGPPQLQRLCCSTTCVANSARRWRVQNRVLGVQHMSYPNNSVKKTCRQNSMHTIDGYTKYPNVSRSLCTSANAAIRKIEQTSYMLSSILRLRTFSQLSFSCFPPSFSRPIPRSTHSWLPISLNLDKARAKAKRSSSPLKILLFFNAFFESVFRKDALCFDYPTATIYRW